MREQGNLVPCPQLFTLWDNFTWANVIPNYLHLFILWNMLSQIPELFIIKYNTGHIGMDGKWIATGEKSLRSIPICSSTLLPLSWVYASWIISPANQSQMAWKVLNNLFVLWLYYLLENHLEDHMSYGKQLESYLGK